MGSITRKSTRMDSDELSIYISVRTTKSVIGAVPISRTMGVRRVLIYLYPLVVIVRTVSDRMFSLKFNRTCLVSKLTCR